MEPGKDPYAALVPWVGQAWSTVITVTREGTISGEIVECAFVGCMGVFKKKLLTFFQIIFLYILYKNAYLLFIKIT